VTGDSKEIGGEMASNLIVRKLTFTGSAGVGELVMEQCAGTVKNCRWNWAVTPLQRFRRSDRTS
jgi:acyl-CoA reductase-like NAD-dependent aldehyde dehydrogenase